MLTVTLSGFLFLGKIWVKKLNIAIRAQSTYIPRIPQCLSPHWHWNPPPLSCKRVCPLPQPKGGGHVRLQVRGWGSPDSDDWRKSLALCLPCVSLKFTHKTTLLDSLVYTLKTKIVDYSYSFTVFVFIGCMPRDKKRRSSEGCVIAHSSSGCGVAF